MTQGGKRFLVVYAHPLADSLAASLRDAVLDGLDAAGHESDLIDLYADGFDPRLGAAEREAFMRPGYVPPPGIAGYCERLRAADGIVFVFPQWWFDMPAILKGFVDRVFAPGVACDHHPEGGRLIPLLDRLQTFHVVTTTGSPWWVAKLVMRNPVRRQIGIGIARACRRGVRFRMLSLHGLDTASREKCAAFLAKVRAEFARL